MKDAQKEFKGCPLPCEKKNTIRCRRTSCQELAKYLNSPPYETCLYRDDTKFCLKTGCIKCKQWNEAFHWQENVGWDSKFLRYQIPDLQEDVTISPVDKIPKNVLNEIKEKLYPQPQEEIIKRYTRFTIGKKRRSYIILNPNALKEAWVEERVKKLPANAKIVFEDKLRKSYEIDSLIDKAADKVAKTRSIPYENALVLVYKTSRPCKNPSCPSRIPHPKFKVVDKRKLFCCDACQKSYQRSKT